MNSPVPAHAPETKGGSFEIGTKITLTLGGIVMLVASLWCVQAIHAAVRASQRQSHTTTPAERISSDVGAIAQLPGLSPRLVCK